MAAELGAALRPAALAVRADGDRRQPLRAAAGPPDHRPAEGPGVQLVLPRHRRRDASRSTDGGRPARGRATSARRSTPPPPPGWSSSTTSQALERALAPGDVACVLAEPALTNIGIVLPEPGFHDALRELTREHRDAAGDRRDPHASAPGPAATPPPQGLEPDMLTIGKAIAGGIPSGGLRDDRGGRRADLRHADARASRTSAASAARWPATRCRWPRPGRRSSEVLTRRGVRAHDRAGRAVRRPA